MGLNDQLHKMPNKGERKFVFKDGVKYKHMTGKDPIVFRILPSFDPANADPSTSCLPFITPTGELTDWASILYISRFIGHGRGGYGSRQDIISLRSFGNQMCPLDQLLKSISQMATEWGYLLEDQGDPNDRKRERQAFSKPLPHFITNILDLNNASLGVQVACFTSSACNALTDAKTGLIFQRNNVPAEVVQNNYLLQYAVGDMTHPTSGPALICSKGDEQGEYSKYKVILALDGQNRVIVRPIEPATLAGRYNMSKLDTIVNIPSEEEIVENLVQLLNMRSPSGYHEYALLRQTFPSHRIPDAPSAPAASSTIAAGGFGTGPVGDFGMPPAPVIPGSTADAQAAGMVASATAPAYVAPVAAPVYVAPVPAPVIPGMPSTPAIQPAAYVAPVAAPVYVAPSTEVAGAVANMQAGGGVAPVYVAPTAPVAAVTPGGPVAPGDPVSAFDKNTFLSRVQNMGK